MHLYVYVCVQCILYCVYLSHALNIVAPSRSCIPCLSFFTFHYVLLCSFSKFQWLWLRLWLGLLSRYRYFHLYLLCIYHNCLCVCAVCVRVLVSSTIELIDV